jgi:hypothetical protein
MNNMTLGDIIKVTKGLNILANEGIGFKDVELSFALAQFKGESTKLQEALQEVVKGLTGTDEENNIALQGLLDKKHKIDMPSIKLSAMKEATKEIPLLAFDFLKDIIVK